MLNEEINKEIPIRPLVCCDNQRERAGKTLETEMRDCEVY